MKKISFNEGTLSFDKNKVIYEVPLEKTAVQSLEEIECLKQDAIYFFAINRLGFNENSHSLFMEFEVKSGFVPLGVFKSTSTDTEKYEFIKVISLIAKQLKDKEKIVTVFDDRNILINPESLEIKFLYRGVRGLMPSASYELEDIETQVRRVALFILTTVKFDELRLNGFDAAIGKTTPERYKVISKILNTLSLNDIFDYMEALQGELWSSKNNVEDMSKKSMKSVFLNLSVIKKIIGERINTFIGKRKIESKIKSFRWSKIKLVIGAIIGVILMIFMISSFSSRNQLNHNNELTNNQTDEKLIINGLQDAAIQDYKNAAKHFVKLKTPFTKLSKENKKAILFSYLMTGKYQEAIVAQPDFSYRVINYLVSKDDLEEVKHINSTEPVIIFEKAAIANDYKTILKYKDQVELDPRRESLVVNAYIALNKIDEGIKFAKSRGNKDLKNKIEDIKNAKGQLSSNQINQSEILPQ